MSASLAADLVRIVDALEDRAGTRYLTLDEVEAAAGGEDLRWAIEDALLLVDYRTRVDGSPVTLCRLNRHHPLVVELMRW